MRLIREIVLKKNKAKLLEHENKVTMTLTFFTLNVDVINMSNAHPSLFRSCLYNQTAIYYFIEAS